MGKLILVSGSTMKSLSLSYNDLILSAEITTYASMEQQHSGFQGQKKVNKEKKILAKFFTLINFQNYNK